MTEEVLDTTQGDTQETAAPPTPAISAPSQEVASAQPFDAAALDKSLADMQEAIDKIPSLVDARYKATTDRPMSDVRKIAEYLEKAGGDVEQASRNMMLDRMIEGQAQPPGGVVGTTTSEGTAGVYDSNKAAEILAEANIAFDDPEVAEWSGKSYTSDAQAEIALQAIADTRKRQGNVTSNTVVAPSGGVVPVEDDTYEGAAEELKSLRGKRDDESAKRRKEIQADMAQFEAENPDIFDGFTEADFRE